jgi:hypothetical protein
VTEEELQLADAAVSMLCGDVISVWQSIHTAMTASRKPRLTDEEKRKRKQRIEDQRTAVEERKEARVDIVQARLKSIHAHVTAGTVVVLSTVDDTGLIIG